MLQLDHLTRPTNVRWGEKPQPTVVSVNRNTGSFSNTVAGVVLIVFNPDGTERWRKTEASWASGPVAIGPDDSIAQARADRLASPEQTFTGQNLYVYDRDGGLNWMTVIDPGEITGGPRLVSLSFDGDSNLFACKVETGSASLVKYGPTGANLWDVVVGETGGRISADPWGNVAIAITSDELRLYDPNGAQKWSASLPFTGDADVACDTKGNVWLRGSEAIAKYSHSGQELFSTATPESPPSIDCDGSSGGHAWVMVGTFEDTGAQAYEFDQDGQQQRTIIFPPVFVDMAHNPLPSFEGISAASPDISYAGGWHSLIGEPDYRVWWAHRNKRDGVNRWAVQEIDTVGSPVPIDFVWSVPETMDLAKRFIGTMRSAESEPV